MPPARLAPSSPPVDGVRRAGDILAIVVLGLVLAVIGGTLLALWVVYLARTFT